MKLIDRLIRILRGSPKTLWEILDPWPYTIGELFEALKKLYTLGYITVENGLIRIAPGVAITNKAMPLTKALLCPLCNGKRVDIGGLQDLLETYKTLVDKRPKPSSEYYQGFILPEDVVARALFMQLNDDLEGKRIILIGDDDLLSIALGLTNLPKEITVLDIDARIGKFIERIASKENLKITFYRYDVSDPLPKWALKRYDVFSSEPLETISGLEAFLSRGVACLRDKGSSGYFGLTTLETPLKRWSKVEAMLLRMKCVITDIIRDFSRYIRDEFSSAKIEALLPFRLKEDEGATLWYRSSLIRVETLDGFKPLIRWDQPLRVKSMDVKWHLDNPLNPLIRQHQKYR